MKGANEILRKIIFVLLIFLGGIIVILSNPLRKTQENIRRDVLLLTPIGSTIEEVIDVIENNSRWKILWIDYDNNSSYTDLIYDRIIGDKAIKVLGGSYRNIFETFVEIYWGFDGEGKLIEVGVRKTTASL